MKKLNQILSLLLVVLMAVSMFSVVSFAAEDAAEAAEAAAAPAADAAEGAEKPAAKHVDPSKFASSQGQTIPASYTKVSENAKLSLFLDYNSGEFALLNKADNTCFFSNPIDREKDDFASSETVATASSQVILDYITASFTDASVTSMDAKVITEKYGDSMVISYFFDSESTFFIVPIMLTLKSDYLEVELLVDSIHEMSDSRILAISVMPMFGAGNPQDQGYVFIPDGMGSLMYFNGKYTNVNVYQGTVYGKDPTSSAAVNSYTYGQDMTEGIRLPVYGVKKNNAAYLAIMTQSEANVTLTGYCSGMINSYNFIYPKLNLRDSQTRRTAAGNTGAGIYYSDELPENLKIRIYPLAGNQADYIGMANTYRKYLTNDIGMKELDKDTKTPMNVTLIGAYKRTMHFLGLPYTGIDTMTTFDQAESILTGLNEAGVDNMVCGMIGWSKGGLEDAASYKFTPESKLGGTKGAKSLIAKANELGVPMMFDVDLVNFYKASGNYKKFNSTVYGLDLSPVSMFPFVISLNRVDHSQKAHYLFHPTAMLSIANSFVDSASKYDVKDFSFSTIGEQPFAAYNKEDISTRDQTTKKISAIFDSVAEKADGVITSSLGNAYTFPSVNNVVGAPLYSSHLYSAKNEVPFYYIALRGLVRLSGPAINLSSETEDVILRSAQYGVGVYAVLSNESSNNLKDTSYNKYYSTQYDLLKDDVTNAYKRLKAVYDAVGTAQLVGFQKVSDQLKISTFANGAKVYVNYSDADITYNGIKIAASDFTVVGGDK